MTIILFLASLFFAGMWILTLYRLAQQERLNNAKDDTIDALYCVIIKLQEKHS